ncbi:MMPL family transporter [Maridesulfovibrio sp. FT414]|uniref:MMPL family transporter n=1 Tax=Maridesulfovibrio sp. FT414 TaxID=2979469 RepID=UPI003D807B9D
MFFPNRHNNSKLNTKSQFLSTLSLLIFLLICSIPLLSVSFSEDISAMIPSGENGKVSRDFALLQKAPLAGKILISISSDTLDEDKLCEIALSMTTRMNTPLLAESNSLETTPLEIIDYLLSQAPNITTKNDIKKLETLTHSEAIHKSLTNAKNVLLSPTGIGMRGIIAADPLNLRLTYLPKIASMQNLPSTKKVGNRFFVTGKNALLLIAKTNIPMTDSQNGQLLLERFTKIKEETMAEYSLSETSIQINLLSGHSYTVANATIIKQDILKVSLISLGALSALFFFSFRNKGALSVFLAPGVAIITGLGCCAYVYSNMSAIVIGFGAVLMGISIDFAVHIYFALAENHREKRSAYQKVCKPILFGAATSCASFASLYISGIPGIKQLSIFSVAGIFASCIYALIIVPQFCNEFPYANKAHAYHQIKGNKNIILWTTGLILVASIICALNNHFDTELKNLGYISKEISCTEKHFQEKWGSVRSQSMIFASGKTIDAALHNNEKAWMDIKKNLSGIEAVSLAETLPSYKTIEENRTRWSSFWNENAEHTTQAILDSSKQLGFAPKAFLSAMDRLSATPPTLDTITFSSSPLSFLYDLLIPPCDNEQEQLVMTLLPDSQLINDYYSPQKEKEMGVHLVSQSRFKSNLEQEMKLDIIKFISCSGIAVAVLIFGLFRNLRRAILALFPAIFGVVATFGLLGLLQFPLNIFHIVALPLVIGLGADYGIFMVFQEISAPSLWTIKAVKISGLTTLAGFGVLIFAKHPSLQSLGATVSIGITAALCCAVFVLPQLLHLVGDKRA